MLTALVCAVLVVLAAPLSAQQAPSDEVRVRSWAYHPPPAVMQFEANQVQVGVVVRDGQGRVVSGLERHDFEIYEDGSQQHVSSFSVETRPARLPSGTTAASGAPPSSDAPPRYVALFFDDLHTQPGDMRHVQLAAENFIHNGLGPNDQIGLATASSSESIDFTADASKVLDAVAKLKSHARIFDSGTCPRISANDAYLIANHLDPDAYDTAYATAKECNCDGIANPDRTCYSQQQQVVMVQAQQTWDAMRSLSESTIASIRGVVNYLAAQPGERVLVLASSGFLSGTLDTEIDGVVDEALRAGIVMNSLDAKALFADTPAHGRMQSDVTASGVAGTMEMRREAEDFNPAMMNASSAMINFAVGTGGRFFHDRNDLSAGYDSLAAAPQTEYLLGFAPEKEKLNGSFHRLKVELSLPGKFDVQARPGYYAVKKAVAAETKLTLEQAVDQAVAGNNDQANLPGSASSQFRQTAYGIREIAAKFHVDLRQLPVVHEQDRAVEQLDFVAALFDAKGAFILGKAGEMHLALKPNTLDRLSKTGIDATMTLAAPPAGGYRLRMVMVEGAKSEIYAHSETVEVH